MGRAIVMISRSAAGWLPWSRLCLPKSWIASFETVLGDYRPEKHYMRGPGPKWRAKYGAAAPSPDRPA